MPTPPSNGVEKPLLGIVFVLTAAFLFSTTDAATKYLVASYTPAQIIFVRGVFSLLIVIPFLVRRSGWRKVFYTKKPMAQAARAVIGAVETLAFFWAIGHMPLADATAIYFAAPFLMVVLSIPLLGEKVGLNRLMAVAIGFVGVLLVVQPNQDGVSLAALVALLGMALYALMLIMTRWLTRTESEQTLLVYMLIGLTLAGAVYMPFEWVTPAPRDMVLMAVLGVISSIALHYLNRAFALAPVAVIAPFDYSYLIWAVLYGYLFWGEFPPLLVWGGTGIIVAMGIYILRREARAQSAVPPIVHGGTHP